MSGAVLTHVPYKGTGPALADLLGGHIPMMFASTASARPLVLSGKLRALGVSTAQRSPAMPDVPPLAESGVPDYDMASWAGLLAPRATPSAIVAKLYGEIASVLSHAELRDKLVALGYVPQPSSPAAFAEYVRAELLRFKKLVQVAGLSVD
jgi:tripartite-type tricarboxylate transporter receptor subunit TctC